jgi:hypothetical protein
MSKSLWNKRICGHKIDVIFKEYNTITNSPRFIFISINNVVLKLNYKVIMYVVNEEIMYPSKIPK